MDSIDLKFTLIKDVPELSLKQTVLKNVETAQKMRKEIIRLKKYALVSSDVDQIYYQINKPVESDSKDSFEEDAYDFYYEPIKELDVSNLTDDELDSEIGNYIPSSDNRVVIIRVKAEIMREVIEYKKMSMDNDFQSDKEMLNEIRDIINSLNRKLLSIDRVLNREMKDNSFKRKIENKIVFLTTKSGNNVLWRDLKDIPDEYYPEFKGLLDSIIDGTFKNLKKFYSTNKVNNGLLEVKDFKTRIIFDRLDKNTFIILSAFMKKVDIDRFYMQNIDNIATNYRLNENYYKELIKDSEKMEEQEKEKEAIYEELTKRSKVKRRG